jgi:Zn finger protein HypA/HybF involved in hydrogenase expression
MGSRYDYICSKCGYTVQVSGGMGVGMSAIVVDSMVCDDCKEVVDVSVGSCTNVRPLANEPDDSMKVCPTCNGVNVRKWSRKRCPKCRSGYMQPDYSTKVLWD